MSHVIDVLEQLGQDADLCHASREMLEQALRKAGIDPALRAALLGEDYRAIEVLLGAQSNVCCIVWKEDEQEDEEEEPEQEDEEDEKEE